MGGGVAPPPEYTEEGKEVKMGKPEGLGELDGAPRSELGNAQVGNGEVAHGGRSFEMPA